ncbi:gamma-glutamylcyclotransferase family protein [Aspergillus foveolatus]|uniref:gamma-glutamylcyclotransferase family protein n=1 Tax=Aspergillus foveolatus TaxID=210207 RepID=UPI003CCDB589
MPAASRHKPKIYFAYGGNMHLKQMVKRCPSARYLGVAKLHGYRWQINERGYANVVEASVETRERPTTVQGLCYLIGAEDELKLDRVEGVPNAYQKRVLRAELVLAKSSLVGRDVSEIASFSGEQLKAGSGRGEPEVVEALAYVSKDYIKDGPPKGEYAARMRLGLRDALELGMSKEYARFIERVVAVGNRAAGAGAGGMDRPPATSPRPRPQPSRTDAPRASPPTSPASASYYYFAFGSNMQLAQMVDRCPGSKVFAKGILPGYRWHINERGVANIVATAAQGGDGSVVQGILFTVSPKDVKTLDKKEGIAKGYYEKILLRVKVEPLAISGLKGVKTVVAAGKLASNSQAEARESRKHRHGQGQHGQRADGIGVREVEALVYLSSQYKKDGHIRAEYVGRMQLAMADALKLGVDEAYLRASLHPCVFGVDEGAVSAQGRRDIIVRQPAGDAGGAAQKSGSPKDPRIIERVPAGTGYQAAA